MKKSFYFNTWVRSFIIIIGILLVILVIFFINTRYKTHLESLDRQFEDELTSLTAEELVEENIKCRNEHNEQKFKLTLLPDKRNRQDNLNDIDWWHLLDIKEIDVESEYLKTYSDVDDIKRFRVKYDVKWKRNPPYKDGEYFWTYTTVKPSEDDRWYIATCGF